MNRQSISPVMRQLSAYIAQALHKPLPSPVVEKTKHHLLDTIAAMLSGSCLLPGKEAISFVRSLGGAKEACVTTACWLMPTRPTIRMRRR
ncbi:MAG: MmgE/PrpD family protein [Betaproteobacteria bacterium]|nr:MAG: MmgE/PrpD family protein [Betaproteobacteria bacterium]